MVRNKQNTPGIIKYPFRRMTYENPKTVYARVHQGEALNFSMPVSVPYPWAFRFS